MKKGRILQIQGIQEVEYQAQETSEALENPFKYFSHNKLPTAF